jgi:hypothetical protein
MKELCFWQINMGNQKQENDNWIEVQGTPF